jgi:hypothetical protein
VPTEGIEQDELAALLGAVYEAEGKPYRFVFRGDGINWVSVECEPLEEGR